MAFILTGPSHGEGADGNVRSQTPTKWKYGVKKKEKKKEDSKF